MDCFLNLVGVKGCGLAAPRSGRYINVLPGFTAQGLDGMAEAGTFVDLFDDIQQRALGRMRAAISNAFKAEKAYRLKTVPHLVDLGFAVDTADNQTAAQAQWRGFTMTLATKNGARTSALQSIYLHSLSLYAKAAVPNVAIKLFNLDTGAVLDTLSVTTVANGWAMKEVLKHYNASRLFVAYDATAIESVSNEVPAYAKQQCNHCSGAVYGYNGCDATVQGGISVDLNNVAPVPGSNLFGLSAVLSVRCTYDWVVCNNIDLFTDAWTYLLAAELEFQRLETERINPYTTLKVEDAESRLHLYTRRFEEFTKSAVRGLDIDLRDCCLDCDPIVQFNTRNT